MTDGKSGVTPTEAEALDGISVAPPAPEEGEAATPSTPAHPTTKIREGADARSHDAPADDPDAEPG